MLNLSLTGLRKLYVKYLTRDLTFFKLELSLTILITPAISSCRADLSLKINIPVFSKLFFGNEEKRILFQIWQ
jgi:hypothetical protein